MEPNYRRVEIRKELIIEKLREHGCRMTMQRQLLLDVILEQECTSCKEIYYKVNALDSSIGIATVYRMINLLEEIGVLDRANIYKPVLDENRECAIEFDDGTVCKLTWQKWCKVVEAGLKVYGYGSGKKMVSVTLD